MDSPLRPTLYKHVLTLAFIGSYLIDFHTSSAQECSPITCNEPGRGNINCTKCVHEIDCINKDLSKIPNCNGAGIESLDLRKNQIQDFEDDLNHYSELKKLCLEDNKMTEIEPETFGSLGSLKELLLHRNLIESIHEESFKEGLRGIEIINLASNKLKSFDVSTFQNLSSLKKLYLGNNSLLTIPNEAFAGTTSLTTLDLSRNSLTHIGVELFENIPNLKTLRIDHNPNLKAFPVTVLAFISLDTLILSGNTFNCNCQSDVIKLSNIFKNASSTWKPPKCDNKMNFTALESECTYISNIESQRLSNKSEKTTKQDCHTTNQRVTRTNESSHIMYVMVKPALVIALVILALVILIVFFLVLFLVCLIKKRKTCPPQDQRDDVGQRTATDNPDNERMQYVSTISSSLLTESQQNRLLSRNCGCQNRTIMEV